jgi:hypothetical protein
MNNFGENNGGNNTIATAPKATKKVSKPKTLIKAKNTFRKRNSVANKLRKTMNASRRARIAEVRNPKREINERISKYKTEVREIVNDEANDSIEKLIRLSKYIETLFYKLNNHPELDLQTDLIVELDSTGIIFDLEKTIQKALDMISKKTSNKNNAEDNLHKLFSGLII